MANTGKENTVEEDRGITTYWSETLQKNVTVPESEVDWESMTATEAEALAAGLYAEELCAYCGGEGGEPGPVDFYVPCPMCNDGREA